MRGPFAAVIVALVLGPPISLRAAPGDPIGGEFQVNTYTTGSQAQPAVGPIGAGGLVVLWQSNGSSGTDTNGSSIQGQRYDAAGVPVGSQFQVNSYTTAEQAAPEVVPIGDGGLVVVWHSNAGGGTDASFQSIHGQRLDATGMPVGGEFEVNTYTTGDQYSPGVAPAGAGGFVVVWNSFGSPGTDTSSASIQGQRFDASGMPLGGEFQVNTYTTGAQYDAAVGPDGAGGFVVAWTSTSSDGPDTISTSVQGQRFDASGAPVGGQFQVNTYTTDSQRYSSVTSLGAGGFVVVWQSTGSAGTDTSAGSVQAQRFDAGGAPVDGEFQVNTYTTSTQRFPAVGPDGAGGFVVLWGSYGSSGTDDEGRSAQARRFDATGAPLGDEFQVNTYTTSDQQAYAVGPAGAGDFVVVWSSTGSGTDADGSIQGQRFDGPDIVTTTTTSPPAGATTTTTSTLPFAGERLTGQTLQLRTKAGRADRAKLALLSKDRSLTLGRGSGSPDDPVTSGGTLAISSDGGSAVRHDLAGAWRYLGQAGQNKGYKWKSGSAPIRTVVIRRGKVVKIAGRGALGFDLDGDPRPVRLELGIGGHLYCFEFGGQPVNFRLNKLFKARRAPAPATCP